MVSSELSSSSGCCCSCSSSDARSILARNARLFNIWPIRRHVMSPLFGQNGNADPWICWSCSSSCCSCRSCRLGWTSWRWSRNASSTRPSTPSSTTTTTTRNDCSSADGCRCSSHSSCSTGCSNATTAAATGCSTTSCCSRCCSCPATAGPTGSSSRCSATTSGPNRAVPVWCPVPRSGSTTTVSSSSCCCSCWDDGCCLSNATVPGPMICFSAISRMLSTILFPTIIFTPEHYNKYTRVLLMRRKQFKC
ncbi:hypothetical protein J437_LFUL000276 [Ladona fulva]|uniref:Uncharacterized protein n=1 Tax=Ladona fulva TaxID=123851 RepID=A0A8K0K696_LADFU|nr:hypothetical protein J437_LFUL000276 [Ladona fulva]